MSLTNASFLPGRVTDRVNELFESGAFTVLKLTRLLVPSGDIDVSHSGDGWWSLVYGFRISADSGVGAIGGDFEEFAASWWGRCISEEMEPQEGCLVQAEKTA